MRQAPPLINMSVNAVEVKVKERAAESRIVDLSIFLNAAEREKVLIVNHLPVARRLLVNDISDKYNCVEASSMLEASAILKDECFSVVITDAYLPGPSGIELLRSVVANYRDTSVIVLSDNNRPQRALDAVRQGAFDYLIKPCDRNVLQMTIERAIERRRLLIDARRYKQDLEQRNIELEKGKRELQRLQAQIVHSEKMASLGQLAAGVAHELNNPAAFVYGNLDILRERLVGLMRLLELYENARLGEEDAAAIKQCKNDIAYQRARTECTEIIDDCVDGTVRIRDIVQNLRTFSRLDEAEYKKTDVNEGINSTLRLLSKYFTADNIKLVRDLGELPEIDAFGGQLNQVWMNLLVNAAQAVANDGGEVTISTRLIDRELVVSVSDTGSGIPPDILNKIFDPFFTTKPVGEGSGLGLSITFGIVERHLGKIEVESRLGEGTTFTVRIPVVNYFPTTPDHISQNEVLTI